MAITNRKAIEATTMGIGEARATLNAAVAEIARTAATSKEFNRRLARESGRILRRLGCFTRYCTDGLTGHGRYWFAANESRITRRAGEGTYQTLLSYLCSSEKVTP